MRLFILTAITMTAFAANSVLNRAAVAEAGMDAVSFGVIRLLSGALALAILVAWQKRGFSVGGLGRGVAVAGLLAYIFGFSLAYRALDAGLGALILFGVVQVTMFGGAVASGETMPRARWLGAVLALAGLVWLLWPTQGFTVSLVHVLAMFTAGIGWGIYSLQGRRERDATQATAMNFILAALVAVVVGLLWGLEMALPAYGVVLAVISGVVTSGLGYALWYAVLPELGASRAAVAQLSVPVIAMAGGMVFLGEPVTGRFLGAAGLVIAGVLVSVLGTSRRS